MYVAQIMRLNKPQVDDYLSLILNLRTGTSHGQHSSSNIKSNYACTLLLTANSAKDFSEIKITPANYIGKWKNLFITKCKFNS